MVFRKRAQASRYSYFLDFLPIPSTGDYFDTEAREVVDHRGRREPYSEENDLLAGGGGLGGHARHATFRFYAVDRLSWRREEIKKRFQVSQTLSHNFLFPRHVHREEIKSNL
eukprot:451542-Amorphochlora_amoeboformis.AAC.2